MATVDPLPLVPATVMTGQGGRCHFNLCSVRCRRSSPRSMAFECSVSCQASQSASVACFIERQAVTLSKGSDLRSGLLQEHCKQAGDPIAQIATIHDHVQSAMLEQEFATLKSFRE